MSPTKFVPNLCTESCQTLFATLPISAPKKAFHPVLKKKPCKYVGEIDRWFLSFKAKLFNNN